MTLFYKTPSTLRTGAKSLPGQYYTSTEIFAEEIEKIVYRRWFCIGREDSIPQPGDYMLRQVGQENLLIVRDRHTQIHAFYNLCRHRATRLCAEPAGHLSGLIHCPYHAWGYGLDGSLLVAPFMDAVDGFRKEDFPLHRVAIARWEGFLFVNLSEAPEPFAQAFAPMIDRFIPWQMPTLRTGYHLEYDLHANWKILIQNYSECYHCPTVHPELMKFSAASSSANDLFRGPFLGGPMSIDPPYTSLSEGGDRTLPILGTVSGEDVQRAYYYLLFPNLLLSLQPDFVMVHRLEPQSPSQTRVYCDWLFAPETIAQADFNPEAIVTIWDRVNRQDWELCESVQQGVSSRAYTPGFYAGQESLCAEIDLEVLKALGHEGW